jgi:hypothetical protein
MKTLRIVGLHSTSSPFFDDTRMPSNLSCVSSSSIFCTRIAIPEAPGSVTRIENSFRGIPLNSRNSMRALLPGTTAVIVR